MGYIITKKSKQIYRRLYPLPFLTPTQVTGISGPPRDENGAQRDCNEKKGKKRGCIENLKKNAENAGFIGSGHKKMEKCGNLERDLIRV